MAVELDFTDVLPALDPKHISGARIYLYEWVGPLQGAFDGRIIILARSLEEARRNFKLFRDDYNNVGKPDLLSHLWIGDFPCCEGTNAIIENKPDRVLDVTDVLLGGAYFVGCHGSD